MITAEAIRAVKANPDAAQRAQDAFQEVLARSATDRAFRSKLIESPRAALAEFSGQDESALPPFEVKFIENSATATIVLPEYSDPTAELSEADLETVAGGTDPVTTMIVSAAVIGAIAGGITIGIEWHKATCDRH
ncbi:hypothetical protein [Gemmatimonas sp.]|jgi:hypothetical protein|uniref:hypothetical protein n=1 Tax=Gemmatimonas sp. TaxID=1962908 RepID=UPI0037C122F2